MTGSSWNNRDDGSKTISLPAAVTAGSENLPGEKAETAGKDYLSRLQLKPQERYQFLRSIGFGGMKGVLLVHDRDTGRDVAMAIMPDFRERSREDLNRFAGEAFISAGLQHPNIVPVHDLGIDDQGSPFFTMQYLDGRTLGQIMQMLESGDPEITREYRQAKLLRIFQRVCNAVAFAHSRGIGHFDIKPGNIFCGKYGEVQLIDWGIAAGLTERFRPGSVKGTPGFIAPELLSAVPGVPGAAADIYSLGALLYTILTGRPPLEGLPAEEKIRRTFLGKIPPPSAVRQGTPPALEAICLKAMACKPENRYRNVEELIAEINAYFADSAAMAEYATLPWLLYLGLKRNWHRHPVLMLTAAALPAVILVLILIFKG